MRRDGDTWYLTWPTYGVGFGLDHLKEGSDGLRAELTVESITVGKQGRLAGPTHLNLLSTRSQAETANKLEKRLNGAALKIDVDSLITQTCAIVATQYRAPTPTMNLAEVETSGEVEYLIPGVVPVDETTVLYGDGESSKSLLVLRIAFSVVTGKQLPWGSRPTAMGAVLYLDWETNPRTVAGRLRRIAYGEDAAVPEVHYRQCFRTLNDELPNVREEISKKGVALVIVDSIGFAASGALVEDETARSAMNALRQMSPATRLVVAHVSADTARQTTGAARPFGSAFFWNGMRSGLELRRAEDSGPDSDAFDIGLYHRKANDGEHHKPIGMRVSFDGRRGAIGFDESSVHDVPDLAARTSLSSRLRELLRDGARNTAELADALDASADTVSKTLKRMPDVIQNPDSVRVSDDDVRVSGRGGRGKAVTWGLAGPAF